MNETFDPPSQEDYEAAWSAVRAIDVGVTLPGRIAQQLARVVYAAERSRYMLAGTPTCAMKEVRDDV